MIDVANVKPQPIVYAESFLVGLWFVAKEQSLIV